MAVLHGRERSPAAAGVQTLANQKSPGRLKRGWNLLQVTERCLLYQITSCLTKLQGNRMSRQCTCPTVVSYGEFPTVVSYARAHAEEAPEKSLENQAAGPAARGATAPVTGGLAAPAAGGMAAPVIAGAANAEGRDGAAAPVAGGAGGPLMGRTAKLPDAREAGWQGSGSGAVAPGDDAVLFARLDALARLEEQGEKGEGEEEEENGIGGVPGREVLVGREGHGGETAGELDEEDRIGDILGLGSETLYGHQARESVGATAAQEQPSLSVPALDQVGPSGSGRSASAAPGMRRGFFNKPKPARCERPSPELGAPPGAQHGGETGGAPTQPYPKPAPQPGDPSGGSPSALPGAQPGAVVERVPALPHPRLGNPSEGSGSNVQRVVSRGILKMGAEEHAEPAARPVSRFKQRRQAGGGA